MDVWRAAFGIPKCLVCFLGHAAIHDDRPVHIADSSLDARLHRIVLLAAVEAVVQNGLATLLRNCDIAAAARHAWRRSRCARRDRTREGSGMEGGESQGTAVGRASGKHGASKPGILPV